MQIHGKQWTMSIAETDFTDSGRNNGWLRPHKTDSKEIANLLTIVDRDMDDAAARHISDDWKF